MRPLKKEDVKHIVSYEVAPKGSRNMKIIRTDVLVGAINHVRTEIEDLHPKYIDHEFWINYLEVIDILRQTFKPLLENNGEWSGEITK